MRSMLLTLRSSLAAVALGLLPMLSSAADFPAKPVQIIVPFTAGGVLDQLARSVADDMSKRMTQPVLVVNKPGAGGIIGAQFVQRAPADGYNILLGSTGMTIVPAIKKIPPFDPIRDFTPVAFALRGPFVLSVNPKLPVDSVRELVAVARQKPIAYSTSGIGTANHMTAEYLKSITGMDATTVPYKGSSESLAAVAAGDVAFTVDTIPTTSIFTQEGTKLQVRPLAVTSSARLPSHPDLPTMQEAGFKGFEAQWYAGFFVPAGTPAEIVSLLRGQIQQAMRRPEVAALIKRAGGLPASESESFSDYLSADVERWKSVASKAAISID